jgi:hypothetical protein
MARHFNTAKTLMQARKMAEIWKSNPGFALEDVKLEDYVTFFTAAEELDKTCAQREVELDGLKANRDDQFRRLHTLVLRFRSGMRSFFGPDSPQYEQAGGIRASARKSSTRKNNPPAPPAPPAA